jgi:hypothetical protein
VQYRNVRQYNDTTGRVQPSTSISNDGETCGVGELLILLRGRALYVLSSLRDIISAEGLFTSAKREDFMKAALDYVEETLMIAEVIRLVPRCLAPYVLDDSTICIGMVILIRPRIVGRMLRKCVSSQAIVYESLMSVAEERVRERDLGIRGKEHVSNFLGEGIARNTDVRGHRMTASNGSWKLHPSRVHGLLNG